MAVAKHTHTFFCLLDGGEECWGCSTGPDDGKVCFEDRLYPPPLRLSPPGQAATKAAPAAMRERGRGGKTSISLYK